MLRADMYVVNAVLAGPAVGIYGFALSVSERVSVVAAPIYGATASHVSGQDLGVAVSTTTALVRAHLWIAVVLFAGGVLGGAWFLELLGGAEYRAGAVPFAILLFGSAILPVWSIVGLFMISQQRAAWTTTILQFGAAALALGLYVPLIRSLGITGAALASAAAYGVLTLAGMAFLVHRRAVTASALLPQIGDLEAAWRILRRYATGA
jgi:O-antigen/teichoic acid export membrane protein